MRPDDMHLLRVAVEAAPSGILAVDASGTILLVNREIERLFGYAREELIGRPVDMLVPERLRGGHGAHRTGFVAAPRSRPMGRGQRLYGVRKDGTEIPVEIGLNPVETEKGLFVLGSVIDLTERMRTERELRQAQKMEAIGTLAGGVAHDFNNTLLAIVGYAEMALRASADRPAVRADLEQVLSAAERGKLLVKRILTFSRARDVSREPIALERPVREALHLLRASLPATIEMRERIDPATPAALVDETEIHQIVMNLATNSAQAMAPSGGWLEVSLDPVLVDAAMAATRPDLRPGLHARLAVTDNGLGMSPEVLARAFEPFFTTKPVGEGTGLGLSVIHGIVKGYRGRVEIDSRPGEGTSVVIFLPAAGAAATAAAEQAPQAAPAAGKHVLLVDDEQILALLVRRQLRDMGHEVTMHTSSLEALDDFRRRPAMFDLLVTDNTMPRMTGLALSQEIRRLRPDLPVLMISGIGDKMDLAELRAQGIAQVLPKPHTTRELEAAVRAALGPGATRA